MALGPGLLLCEFFLEILCFLAWYILVVKLTRITLILGTTMTNMDNLSLRNNDDKYGICVEIKLTGNSWVGSGYLGGARLGSLD